jgi:hypothetical protein
MRLRSSMGSVVGEGGISTSAPSCLSEVVLFGSPGGASLSKTFLWFELDHNHRSTRARGLTPCPSTDWQRCHNKKGIA